MTRAGRVWMGVLWILAAGTAGCGGDDASKGTDPGSTHPEPGMTGDPANPAQNGPQKVPMKASSDLPDLDGASFPVLGARTFETAKDVGDGSGNDGSSVGHGLASPEFGNAAEGVADSASGARAPTTTAPAPAVGQAPATPGDPQTAGADPGVMREIVEADVVQTEGDVLYVLNRYRGLLMVDMSQPDSPYVLGRVPFQAQPVDMYLRDGRAYIVLSDYFTYWQFDADADPFGFHGSQILVVDVSDPAAPQLNGSFNVDGEVTDTRIVGDVLYAVSHRNPEYWRYDTYDWEDTTWVMSINIADPTAIHEVERKEFSGSANVIQVYANALSIAAVDPNYYLVDDQNAQQTLITYVDISDPNGAIKVGDGAYVPGAVADKFKMDLDGGHLRVISTNSYWQPNSADVLTVFDASNPAKLTQSAQLAIDTNVGGQYTGIQATRYAGPDLFVNLCWYVPGNGTQSCRLDLYDLGNASAPVKAGSLPLDGPVTHFEVRGDRLLALGSHQLPGPSYQYFVQVSLYDVADLAHASRLAAIDLANNSSSNAQNDYKAFKVLDELNMILLPLSWTEGSGNLYRYYQGAQIVD